MNEDEIKGLIYHLEEIGASSDVIDEVVAALPNRPPEGTKSPTSDDTALIKQQILSEPDWRKRASMAAGIISNNLDNGY